MRAGLTSIIIPTHDHGRYLAEAIDSALRQTAPVEVIVVDDGSTDEETPRVLAAYAGRIRAFRTDHAGPAAARNLGIDQAEGELLMFLDADDVCVPTKVEQQLPQLVARPEVGWVLCDVRIHDEGRPGHAVLASQKYGLTINRPIGWLGTRLKKGNFIPVMSPLVRRSVVGDIRFPHQAHAEDWPFWQAVAAVARAAYVPDVLATYRRRKDGRNRATLPPRPSGGVLFSPHNDDEALYAAFTIQRVHPKVVVCYPSTGDYGATAVREAESRAALAILGAAGMEQWAGGDVEAQMRALDAKERPARVWAPDQRASHPDHVAVAAAAARVFGGRLTTFHTYVAGDKIRDGRPVAPEPAWVQAKLRALACYQTQISHPRARAFFLGDLAEYYGQEARA
jgi:LmbE family N-acetylglucosaminyl deacetylase